MNGTLSSIKSRKLSLETLIRPCLCIWCFKNSGKPRFHALGPVPWNSSFGTFRAEGRGAKVFSIHFKAIFYLVLLHIWWMQLNAKAEKANFTCLLRNNTKNRSISLIITFRVRTESARLRLIFSSLISSVLQGTLLWKTQDGNSHNNINYAFSERDDAVDE